MYNILIFGDSITWGAVDSKGGWAQRIKNEQGQNSVYVLGISGDTSDGLLKRLKQEALIRLDEDNQTALIIAIGINDSQIELESNINKISVEDFQRNLNEIVRIGKEFAQKLTLVGLTPVDEDKVKPMPWKLTHGYTNEQVEEYNNIIEEVAKEQGVTFLEIYKQFRAGEYKTLLFDGLHPNDKGHELIYDIVLKELKKQKILQ